MLLQNEILNISKESCLLGLSRFFSHSKNISVYLFIYLQKDTFSCHGRSIKTYERSIKNLAFPKSKLTFLHLTSVLTRGCHCAC